MQINLHLIQGIYGAALSRRFEKPIARWPCVDSPANRSKTNYLKRHGNGATFGGGGGIRQAKSL
jgi:hypothetical protein